MINIDLEESQSIICYVNSPHLERHGLNDVVVPLQNSVH